MILWDRKRLMEHVQFLGCFGGLVVGIEVTQQGFRSFGMTRTTTPSNHRTKLWRWKMLREKKKKKKKKERKEQKASSSHQNQPQTSSDNSNKTTIPDITYQQRTAAATEERTAYDSWLGMDAKVVSRTDQLPFAFDCFLFVVFICIFAFFRCPTWLDFWLMHNYSGTIVWFWATTAKCLCIMNKQGLEFPH